MSKQGYHGPLEQIAPCVWRIPQSYKLGMRTEGRIFRRRATHRADPQDQAPEQVANVAFLPGIQVASMAMPDIHWGYGFPIGGVAATDPAEGGVISPGGVGYDINCGVRLLRTNLDEKAQPRLPALVGALFRDIPTGVGATGGPYSRRQGAAAPPIGEGARHLRRPRPGHRRHGAHRGPAASRAPSRTTSARALERGRRPVRHARLREPLPRSPGGGRGLRRRRRPASWASRGP